MIKLKYIFLDRWILLYFKMQENLKIHCLLNNCPEKTSVTFIYKTFSITTHWHITIASNKTICKNRLVVRSTWGNFFCAIKIIRLCARVSYRRIISIVRKTMDYFCCNKIMLTLKNPRNSSFFGAQRNSVQSLLALHRANYNKLPHFAARYQNVCCNESRDDLFMSRIKGDTERRKERRD